MKWSFPALVLGVFLGTLITLTVISLGNGKPDDVCELDCIGRDYDNGVFNRELQRCVCSTTVGASHKELREVLEKSYE